MHVAGYIRVSSVHGRRGESFISPVEQRAAIERLAHGKSLTVTVWLEELDQSGGNAERPKWLAARDLIRRGEVKGVIVLNFSRWSRDTEHALASIREIRDAGGDIWSCQEDFDTRTPAGWMMLTNFFAFAQLYREQAREGFETARKNAIARGVPTGPVPFGYIKGSDKRLVPDPVTAPIVLGLFERKAQGDSLATLVEFTRESGHPLARTSIADLLKSKTYLGQVAWGHAVNERAHEPLVARELFDRAQARRGVKAAPVEGGHSTRAMLKSLLRCSGCGATLLVFGSERSRPNYYCAARNKGGCNARARAVIEEIDQVIDEWVMRTFSSDRTMAEAVESGEYVGKALQDLADAEHALSQVLTNTKLIQVLGADEYTTMVEAHKGAVEIARVEVGLLTSRNEMLNIQGGFVEAWPTLSVTAKRRLLHGFIQEIRVSKGTAPISERIQIIGVGNVILDDAELDARVLST